MQPTTSRPKITVTTDGHGALAADPDLLTGGVASHAGSRLLTDLAEVTGLRQALSRAVGQRRRRRSAHDPDAVLTALLGDIARRAPAGAYISLLADEPGRPLHRRHGFVETAPRTVGMALPIPTAGADSS